MMGLRGKLPWQSGAKEHHKITLHTKSLTQEINLEKHKRAASSILARSRKELSRRQGSYRVWDGGGGQSFPGWPGIGGIL